MRLDKKIYFKEKEKKIAVVVEVESKKGNEVVKSELNVQQDDDNLEHFSLLDEGDDGGGLLSNSSKANAKPRSE